MDWLKLYHECELVSVAREASPVTDIQASLNQLPQRVILSMWKASYLRRADTLQIGLEKAYGEVGVARWTSDLVSRKELTHRLATHQIPLAFYLGHGRERGWAGYRGLRIHHLLSPAKPMGLVVSLSCRTLEFGRELVGEGYAQAFLGSEQAMGVPGLTRMVGNIASIFADEGGPPKTADEFLSAMEQYVSRSTSVELHDTWSQLQFLGSGLTQI